MYLLEYQCLNCGTKFYAEEKEGNLIYCPFMADVKNSKIIKY